MSPKKTATATVATAAAPPAAEEDSKRIVTISVERKNALNLLFSVNEFDTERKALLPPKRHLTLTDDRATFEAEAGKVYAVQYYFLGGVDASIEPTAKTDTQPPDADPIAKLAHKQTKITSDLGFNLGYWRVPTKGVLP